MQLPVEHLSVCEHCGRAYVNFCVSCAKANREELVEELMEKYGLTVESLIKDLSAHIGEGNFGALRLGIEMLSMKPPTKTDVTSGGQPLTVDSNVKKRLASKLAKIIDDSAAD